MKKEKLIIYGVGGHAKSVSDSVDNNLYDVVFFIDNFKTGSFMNKPILKDDFIYKKEANNYSYFIAIGDNKKRSEIFKKIIN